MPEKYLAPPKWYSEKKKIKTKSFRIRLNPENCDIQKLEQYYRKKLKVFDSEILMTRDVVKFTGYRNTTVTGWIRADKLEALVLTTKYLIHKIFLLKWLLSDEYNCIERKSKKHMEALWDAK